jgi:adenylate cyclase
VETFQEDEIFEPYFRSRSSVIALTIFFGYLSIILIYVVGNIIVNPLLFLSMSVRKISESLRSMIRGESRVSAGALQYVDYVSSRDEIKSLSGEIGNMVTVIRGIIPYISTSTLKQAEKGETASSEKELAFLFTDMRGFTTLCEGMKPDQVVGLLNHYLDLETEIIMANGGDVDKFVGDEMMATFDGKDKELRACKAAMEIRHAMMAEKEHRHKKGQQTVEIGIGVNTGSVVFGSVGARDRMDFTSIGDTVNLAARLESANKIYLSKAIITHAVWRNVKNVFLCRELDYIAVKGKNEPVRIFEILQEKSKASAKLVEIAKVFQEGLSAYRKRDWKTAAECFRKNIKDYDDGPSDAFLQRVKLFMKNPPPDDWDGVFHPLAK